MMCIFEAMLAFIVVHHGIWHVAVPTTRTAVLKEAVPSPDRV